MKNEIIDGEAKQKDLWVCRILTWDNFWSFNLDVVLAGDVIYLAIN